MEQTKIETANAAVGGDKPHYELLDGLRGVAALLVVWYHVFEGFAFAGGGVVQGINHGYLAVDFFFMLSGFVVGYAYDDRWAKGLTRKEFFRRRLIRLHPMVVMGALIGVATFLMGGSLQWDGTQIPLSLTMLSMLCALFLLPAVPGTGVEVRGNGEMYPLNGPSWSLFFEYLGNLLYALLIRRFSTRWLTLWVVLLGVLWSLFALTDAAGYGCIGVGWTLEGVNFPGGLLRMLFPFSFGLLLSRRFRPMKIRGAFWICAAVLFILFHVPYIEGSFTLCAAPPSASEAALPAVAVADASTADASAAFAADASVAAASEAVLPAAAASAEGFAICLNGLFEMLCVILFFPLLVWMGASGRTTDSFSTRCCHELGQLSYPLYLVHYPLMYLFYAWLIREQRYTLGETWQVVVPLYLGTLLLAYLCLKCYEQPVRRWLSSRSR